MNNIEKILQIISLMPEDQRSDVHYKVMMMTGSSEKFITPRVKKLLSIYKSLDEEERSIFKASIYCTECDNAKASWDGSEDIQE